MHRRPCRYVINRRTGFAAPRIVESAGFGTGLAATDFASKASPSERAPYNGADLLIEGERHELPLVFASDERVVGLVGDVALQAVFFGDGERFHEVPAGEVRAADVANFAGAHEIVESDENFLDGRHRIEAVQLEEVDIVGAQAAQACFNSPQQMEP